MQHEIYILECTECPFEFCLIRNGAPPFKSIVSYTRELAVHAGQLRSLAGPSVGKLWCRAKNLVPSGITTLITRRARTSPWLVGCGEIVYSRVMNALVRPNRTLGGPYAEANLDMVTVYFRTQLAWFIDVFYRIFRRPRRFRCYPRPNFLNMALPITVGPLTHGVWSVIGSGACPWSPRWSYPHA